MKQTLHPAIQLKSLDRASERSKVSLLHLKYYPMSGLISVPDIDIPLIEQCNAIVHSNQLPDPVYGRNKVIYRSVDIHLVIYGSQEYGNIELFNPHNDDDLWANGLVINGKIWISSINNVTKEHELKQGYHLQNKEAYG